MRITKEEIVHVANLAMLDLNEESIGTFAVQIDNILQYIDMLNRVDTKGVVPTSHAISLTNVFREDKGKEHVDRNKALANAPEKEDGNFVVPKII
ncbi:MAG: Asp-tRNA(Asn)/Glu-tRNA(Gln) amidotransferase subunit GatC [Desulfobacterales bacterium]|nr:Asp-tRNA(Asn)/Glu-tRNA(Gln) amidotransferase subunit GatC [Desulfobacterales bacterium]